METGSGCKLCPEITYQASDLSVHQTIQIPHPLQFVFCRLQRSNVEVYLKQFQTEREDGMETHVICTGSS